MVATPSPDVNCGGRPSALPSMLGNLFPHIAAFWTLTLRFIWFETCGGEFEIKSSFRVLIGAIWGTLTRYRTLNRSLSMCGINIPDAQSVMSASKFLDLPFWSCNTNTHITFKQQWYMKKPLHQDNSFSNISWTHQCSGSHAIWTHYWELVMGTSESLQQPVTTTNAVLHLFCHGHKTQTTHCSSSFGHLYASLQPDFPCWQC